MKQSNSATLQKRKDSDLPALGTEAPEPIRDLTPSTPTRLSSPPVSASPAELAVVDDEPVSLRIADMAFTIPLPGPEPSSAAAQSNLQRSQELLEAGKITAARDACYAILALDPDYPPVFLRLAEINAALGARSAARQQAEALARSLRDRTECPWLWRVHRVLAYVTDDPLEALRHVVDLRIKSKTIGETALYAAYLVRLLSEHGALDEAMDYSTRICELEPANTDAALEHTVLLVKAGHANEAIDRWERAAEAGANVVIGRAALAPIMSTVNEAEHWDMVADIASAARQSRDSSPVQAYRRIAAALEPSSVLSIGAGVLLAIQNPVAAAQVLVPIQNLPDTVEAAIHHVTLASVLTDQRHLQERSQALRAAIQTLENLDHSDDIPWTRLLGWVPTGDELTSRLADSLSDLGDLGAAIAVLSRSFQRSPGNDIIGTRLADAYVETGKLGAALSVLDQLASAKKDDGRLQDMAAILRRMSLIAPNNIRVKTRLIEAFLERGFVAEARAELLHRADLEEQAGEVDAARESLERAAALGWTVGLQEEAFAIYQRVLSLVPSSLEPRHALVTLFLQAGRVTDATEQQRQIVDLALRSKQPHEAIAALHQIIGIAPSDTSAYHQLAELLAGLGEYGQAERVYRRLAMVDPEERIASAKAESMAALSEQGGSQ